ncbi:MAG: hypothetical protein JRE71_19425 [Deltaproteobacteria bacterium]|nr:hypothetical protein [Deltaproteobacteria bacterium]
MASRFVAALTVLLIFSFAGCRTPVGEAPAPITGVDPSDLELIHELRQLDAQIKSLDENLGDYPARFESEEEREEVHARWARALERASILMNIDFDNAELFARTGNLYRQGHNLDVPQAASAAYNSLNRCIALASGHVECHYNLARLFLASSPRFAANAERLLIRVRSLIAPEIRPEFEFALAKAYLAQGRRSAALRQIDYYLSFEPRDVDAQRFRNSLVSDAEGEMQRKRSRTLTPSRAAEQ